MTRSHPPSLITLAERTLREECGVRPGERVLVAVSGGADSTALLAVLSRLAPRLRLELEAHGVDHGLRAEAAAELDSAAELARRLGVRFERTILRVEPGGNLQARARHERYTALERARERCRAALIATAHHADDRAETVLLRLLRGAGPRGLAVLPARAGSRIRPLIRARRAAIEAHLGRHGLAFARDPSNQDRRFLRVRVRLDVLPLLEAASPRIVEHLCALADELGGPPAPVVLGEDGRPLALGRAQLGALRRAQALGLLEARIPLSDGRILALDRQTRTPVLLGPPASVAGSRRRGDAKPRSRS
ncbi:MAG: tRNA lysidine(34) synthetase TilS [Sorangiineae bacterium]|nr:tRNA lysidine(34) synthetase TilS [Polyangiaceae bacterium]MEB2322182.1 tRNA lysidine(34) synthetase TilS [Sorangiineae bacterium]